MADVELKAGHPPAEKVAGVRVSSNKKERRQSESDRVEKTSSASDEVESDVLVKKDCDMHQELMRSFPEESVRRTHEKIVPQLQKQQEQNNSAQVRKNHSVFQPKKFQ